MQAYISKVTTVPKLTKTLVDNCKTPAAGDAWLWDSDVEGFGVRVQASGRKTYVVRYRTKCAARIQRKITIGRCSDYPPEKAREQARKIFAQVADGGDPAAEKKPERAKPTTATLERMFEGYVAHMRTKGRISADEVERALLKGDNCAAEKIGREKAASAVTPHDVVVFVSSFFLRGKRSSADKARSYIASAFSWAIKSANDYTIENRQDWGITSNPAADVAKDTDATNTRDRNLEAFEMQALWLATLAHDGRFTLEVGACIRVLMACGQRVLETLRIEGCEIDLEAKLWRMPAHKTKGKKHNHIIPLPGVVIPTLQALKAQHGDGPLFPGRIAEEQLIKATSVNQSIRRWLAEEGVEVEHFQTRDLRRTWKSRAHDAGVDRFTRDLIQQHAKNDTGSKVYDRADYLPQMREAMGKWSTWLEATLVAKEDDLALAA